MRRCVIRRLKHSVVSLYQKSSFENEIGIKLNQELTQSWLDETHFEIPPAPLFEHLFNRTCCSHAEPVIVFTNQDATEFEEVSDDLIILQGRGNLADSENL